MPWSASENVTDVNVMLQNDNTPRLYVLHQTRQELYGIISLMTTLKCTSFDCHSGSEYPVGDANPTVTSIHKPFYTYSGRFDVYYVNKHDEILYINIEHRGVPKVILCETVGCTTSLLLPLYTQQACYSYPCSSFFISPVDSAPLVYYGQGIMNQTIVHYTNHWLLPYT